jgi:hypothetical protein
MFRRLIMMSIILIQRVMGKLLFQEKQNQNLFKIIFIHFRAQSPIKDNPIVTVDIGIQLQINLNTDQTGRTFQDRTHLFQILPRPGKINCDFF